MTPAADPKRAQRGCGCDQQGEHDAVRSRTLGSHQELQQQAAGGAAHDAQRQERRQQQRATVLHFPDAGDLGAA